LKITGGTIKLADRITIGEHGTGHLIFSGGALTTESATLGLHADAVADVTISNARTWTNLPDEINVAQSGKATLALESGAKFDGISFFTAINSGSDATVTAEGAGTRIDVPGDVILGGEGKSLVQIMDGAVLKTNGAKLGGSISPVGGATSTVQVVGAGARWDNSGNDLDVGGLGTNFLQVTANGRLDTRSLTLGTTSGVIAQSIFRDTLHAQSSGIVATTSLTVGDRVLSKVEIYGEARLFSAFADIGSGANNVGGVVEIAAFGRWDNINSIQIASTSVNSHLLITDQGVVVCKGVDLGSAPIDPTRFALVTIRHLGSSLSSTGEDVNVGQFGNAILTIAENGLLFANDVYIYSAGRIEGDGGAIDANLHNKGGVIAPGDSPGKLTIDGNFDMDSGALNIEFGDKTRVSLTFWTSMAPSRSLPARSISPSSMAISRRVAIVSSFSSATRPRPSAFRTSRWTILAHCRVSSSTLPLPPMGFASPRLMTPWLCPNRGASPCSRSAHSSLWHAAFGAAEHWQLSRTSCDSFARGWCTLRFRV
jgi:T5SS/PEP-CTERM-associated repeat protein